MRRFGRFILTVATAGALVSAGCTAVPEEMPHALSPEMAQVLASQFRKLGFAYVTLDLEGYRQGSLNAALKK